MSSRWNAEQTLAEAAAASPQRRAQLLDDLIREHMSDLEAMARQLRFRHLTSVPHVDQQELLAVVLLEAALFLDELMREPEKLRKLRRFESLLMRRARNEVIKWGMFGHLPLSGMTTLVVRQSEIRRTTSELGQRLGRTPTREEVITETNERMYRTRKNPVKQGVLVSERDFTDPRDMATWDECTEVVQEDNTDDCVLSPVEGQQFRVDLLEVAREEGGDLAAVAQAWLGGFTGPDRVLAEVSQLVELTGLSRRRVESQLDQLRAMAVELLSSRLGITSDNW